MSASVAALSVAPLVGPAAAPKRGATTNADFSAALDDAASTPEPPRRDVAPRRDAKSNTPPVGAGSGDAPALETESTDAPAADGSTGPALPVPVTNPSDVPVEQPSADASGGLPQSLPATPADSDPVDTDAPPTGNKPAEPDAKAPRTPSFDAAAAPLDEPEDLAERPATSAPAPRSPEPAVQTLKAAAAIAAALAAPLVAAPARVLKTSIDPASDAATPDAGSESVALTEAPRVRDAIERAAGTRADGQGTAGSRSDAAGDVQANAAPTSASKPTQSPASAPPAPAGPSIAAAEAPVAPPAPMEEPSALVPGPPAASPAEGRAAGSALSLALSAASHAAIETTAQIAAQIVKRLEGRSTRFEMALTPEGLGKVDVSLDIDSDGKLVARLAFDNPLAATELRGRADELRRQLQDSGFFLAEDALSFAERDASAGRHGGSAFDQRPDPRPGRAFGAGARLSAEADIAVPSRWIPLTLTPDRVDMKV